MAPSLHDHEEQEQVMPPMHDELLHDCFHELAEGMGLMEGMGLVEGMGLNALEANSSPSDFASAPHLLQSDLSNIFKTSNEAECCWGLRLKQLWGRPASEQPPCEPGFRRGKGHMKNKFCVSCRRQGVDIPASHCRVLTPELEEIFVNSTTGGFWTSTKPGKVDGLGQIEYRRVNQTKLCRGPQMALFRHFVPPLAWATLPSDWLSEGDSTLPTFGR